MQFRDYSNYEVYEDGRIWSYKSNKFLKPSTAKGGYQIVRLFDNECKPKWYYVHRVVYETVTCSPIPKELQCNHINEDKTDNRFCNINLLSPKQNVNWGTRNKRSAKALSKQVGAFKDGELVIKFSSTQEAERNGFNSGNVSKCCNGKLKHHKGFEWRYL